MLYNKILPLFLFFFLNNFVTIGSCKNIDFNPEIVNDSAGFSENSSVIFSKQRPSPLLHLFRAKQKKSKKIIATLLAFPLPFGIVGLHRIYLGCAPYVPVSYIATLGGILGILPLIDFCVLIANKDIDRYSDSKKIFMWVN